MRKGLIFVLMLFVCFSATTWAQCVLGIEANGTDSATKKAYDWRKPNVYDGYYKKAGFKVILISQSSKSKVEDAFNKYGKEITHISGCGHGSPTRYTGYRTGTVLSTSDTKLLSQLKGKHVHLLSCLTAQQLGPAIIKQGAKSYAGYHPSFYFTDKSFDKFMAADAHLDYLFSKGKSAPEAKEETIKQFDKLIKDLEISEPSAVRYAVTDRDGLRCLGGRSGQTELVLPLSVLRHTVFAKNRKSGEFYSFAKHHEMKRTLRDGAERVTFAEMNSREFKNMVINVYENMDRNFELGILSHGVFHRDQLIKEIQKGSVVGQKLLKLESNFLTKLTNCRFSKTFTVKTDANGCISASGNADIPMTVKAKGVKGTWSGSVQSFDNIYVELNGEVLYNDKVEQGVKYDIKKTLNSGPASYTINATGGPANTEIKVTVYVSLW